MTDQRTNSGGYSMYGRLIKTRRAAESTTDQSGNGQRRRKKQVGSEVVPRRRPVYPISAERENMRASLAYTEAVISATNPFINEMMKWFDIREGYRQDDAGDFASSLRGARYRAAERISRRTGAMRALEKKSLQAGNMALNHSAKDWGLLVKDATGLEISTEAYVDDMQDMVKAWVHENVSKITSIPDEYLGEVENIIRWGYETKQPKVNVYRRLEKLVGLTKSKAKMIARDQLGTLNAQMTRHEHESAGVGKYKWITKRDSLVRDCHRALHGTIHKWSEPPPMWYMTKSRGIVYTGRYCNPGEDFGCRCTAAPVFDLDVAKELLQNKFKQL